MVKIGIAERRLRHLMLVSGRGYSYDRAAREDGAHFRQVDEGRSRCFSSRDSPALWIITYRGTAVLVCGDRHYAPLLLSTLSPTPSPSSLLLRFFFSVIVVVFRLSLMLHNIEFVFLADVGNSKVTFPSRQAKQQQQKKTICICLPLEPRVSVEVGGLFPSLLYFERCSCGEARRFPPFSHSAFLVSKQYIQ